MTFPHPWVAALVAATTLNTVSACGGPCDKIARFEIECAESPEIAARIRDEGIKDICELALNVEPEALADEVACAEKTEDCKAYKACLAKQELAGGIETLRKAVADKDWITGALTCKSYDEQDALTGDAMKACTDMFTAQYASLVSDKDWTSLRLECEDEFVVKHAEFHGKCKDALGAGAAMLAKTVREVRDGESKVELFSPCYEYKGMAKLISSDAAEKAEALCVEAEKASDAAEAIAEANKNLAASEWMMPYECERTAAELAKLGSDWANKKNAEVVDACYRRLGVAMLKARVDDMSFCEHAVRDVLTGMATYGVSGGDVDALVAKAKVHCK